MGCVIDALERETGRVCIDTFRRCLDSERASIIEYDDSLEREFMDKPGETVRYGGPRSVSLIAKEWQDREPALRLFMDGSRRTYKIADKSRVIADFEQSCPTAISAECRGLLSEAGVALSD